MSEVEPYCYHSLSSANEVRLLELKPGSGVLPIAISLQILSLESIPAYEAISYCWGNTGRNCDVEIHDGGSVKRLLITSSLFTALKQFRHPDRTRLLWADAICINQGDNLEKGVQVALMPKIYSQAHHVLIWLGADMSGLEGVYESILEARKILPTESIDAKQLQEATDGLLERVNTDKRNNQRTWLDHDWKSIAALLSRPWFQRKWIIQEIALAKAATVICGDIVFAWADLADLAMRLAQLGIISMLKESAIMARPVQNISILMLFQVYVGAGTLLDAVQSSPSFFCSDPRDHIFALLSLAKDGFLIKPDYTVKTEDLFQKLTVSSLERGDFNVLSLAPNTLLAGGELDALSNATKMVRILRPRLQTLSLPTWVPDLTRQGDFDSLASYTVRGRLFNAGGSPDAILPKVHSGKFLHLRGFKLDSVAVVSQSFFETFSNPMPDHLRPKGLEEGKDGENKGWRLGLWLQQCRDFFADQNGRLGRAESGRFYRTMTCQLTGMHDRERRNLSRAFAAYIHYNISFHLRRKTISSGPIYKLYLQHGISFGHLMFAVPAARRLCKTPRGHHGLVPVSTRPDDIICIFAGAETPYVVRPTGNSTHTLIGPCYVDGMMDGEAGASGKYEYDDITLE